MAYDYSSTQINLPQNVALALRDFADGIPEADLADDGVEDTPHVTVKYGLHGDDPEAVRALLADEPPVAVRLGKTGYFPNGESGSGDVLHAEVDSPDLHRLNQKIADALPHSDTHPTYKPHATIAYLKPGMGAKYAGDSSLDGHSATVNSVTFSSKDGTTTDIPLTGASTADPELQQRIKANVEKLRAAGAPEDKIREYIEAELESGRRPRGASLAPLAQGATLGFADEILGGINGLDSMVKGRGFRRGYEEGVAKVRDVGKAFAEDHPVASPALEIAGGLIPAGGSVARNVIKESPSLVRSIARSAGAGAGFGAVSGAGTAGGGLEGRARGAAVGGAAGAVTGGVLPILGRAAAVTRNVAKSVVNRGGQPAAARATEVIADALSRDNVPVESLQGANATRAPKMVLDMGGENLRGVARAAQATPSAAKEAIPAALRARHEGLGTRLGRDLEDALGVQRENVFEKADDLLAARRENAKPLYDAAYKAGNIDDPRINELMELPDFKKAYAHARTIAQLEGVDLPEKFTLPKETRALMHIPAVREAIEASHGGPGYSVQALDYTKRAIDDMIRSGQHAPLEAGGLGPTRMRALLDRQHELLDILDKKVPEYAAARDQYAGDLAVEQALDAGRNFLKQDPRLTSKAMQTMTSGEKQTFKVGAVDAIRQEIEKAADGADLTKRIFGTEAKRANIEALFDDPRDANRFREWVKNEAKLVANKNAVLGNSNTASKLAEMGDMAGINLAELAGDVASGNAPRLVRQAVSMAASRRFKGIGSNVADELAPRLTARPGSPQFQSLLRELDQLAAKRQQSSRLGQATIRALAAASGAALNP
jgi:2'-5' RNA ligase